MTASDQKNSKKRSASLQAKQTQPHERVYRSKKELMLNNLLGGVAWGVGSVIGATVIVAVLSYLIATFQSVPLLGDAVTVIIREVNSHQASF